MNLYIYRQWYCYPKKYLFTIFVAALAALIFSSCSTIKNSYYFKTLPNDTSINTTVNRLAESKIRLNDQLSINISSLNPEEDKVYNAAALSANASSGASGIEAKGYLVNVNGVIQLHKLGEIKAAGLTRRELKNKIETDLKPFLKDPVVTVNYLNHRVTVLGEIGKPSVISMPEEQVSILEVLASSGDISTMGKKDNILIIRETDTGKQFKRINLEDHSVFTSEWYYLQPNDVLFIEPSDNKIKTEKRARLQQNISLGLSGISLAIIIINLLVR